MSEFLEESIDMFSPMRRTIGRSLLKYAAGSAITCPYCGDILDWKRTVMMSSSDSKKIKVSCVKCFALADDKATGTPISKLLADASWEVIDGRKI